MTDWFRKQPKIRSGGHRAPAMPTLPIRPIGWTKSTTPTALPEKHEPVSAKVVMHQFARGEVRNLSKAHDDLHAKVVDKLLSLPEFSRMGPEQLTAVIKNMTHKLQSSDLTINFSVAGWFTAPNDTKFYTQMYERGTTRVAGADGGTEKHLKGNKMNTANIRDAADTRVMFGANIDSPDMEGAARFMKTGGTEDAGASSFKINNGQFNPRARQLFAGLNYGRRPNGSTTDYGKSYLVLREGMKHNAIYYMGDTFLKAITADVRVTYGTLFAVLLYTDEDDVVADLINSCYRGMKLDNVMGNMKKLLEAHIYSPINFRQDVDEMHAAESELKGSKGEAIRKNMQDFCVKNSIKLVMIP
jgi:hypothetical protein